MNTYQITFTIKQAIHPLTETVKADNITLAEAAVRQMAKDAGVTIKSITAIVQI